MKIAIKNRFDDSVIYSGEHETLKDAVYSAIATRANLSGADLSGADLSGADLSQTIMPGFPDQEPPKSLKEAAMRTKDWLANDRWVQGKWIDTPDFAYAGTCLACLHGAAAYCGGEFGRELSDKLTEAGYTVGWNDENGRTKEEVLAALDAVAA
jgi:hypothetical protein